jgi:ubiquitin-protein ligase
MASKRLLADVVEVQKPVFGQTGIYYHADEENMSHGFALVFGPVGTPYEDCPMLYEFSIPSTFPFDPPKVEFRTHDGVTRFHPNMYREGKVCLSILHTWEGPKWASTMRLSTVLVTLQSLMDENPIQHEPGYHATEAMKQDYARFVEHACMRFIVERAEALRAKKVQPKALEPFLDVFQERLPGVLERLETRLTARSTEGERTFSCLAYSLTGSTQYKGLLDRVQSLRKN